MEYIEGVITRYFASISIPIIFNKHFSFFQALSMWDLTYENKVCMAQIAVKT